MLNSSRRIILFSRSGFSIVPEIPRGNENLRSRPATDTTERDENGINVDVSRRVSKGRYFLASTMIGRQTADVDLANQIRN